MSRPPLSIIIPTLNAMPRLAECLAALVAGLSSGLVREAIVVDGASSDETVSLVKDMGCKVITLPATARGRGAQLQCGAAQANGEWLLFLHADTVLGDNWVEAVFGHMAQSPDKVGFFKLAFAEQGAGPRRVSALANWRARALALPYGDQGLLISRKLYNELGGYVALPLMEDVDLVRRIGRARLTSLDCFATTSGNKYATGGWWAVPMRNLMLISAFLLGVKPARLARWYK